MHKFKEDKWNKEIEAMFVSVFRQGFFCLKKCFDVENNFYKDLA